VDLIDTIGTINLRPFRELTSSSSTCGSTPGSSEINVVSGARHKTARLIVDRPAIAININPKDCVKLLIGISRPETVTHDRLAVLVESEFLPLQTISSNVRV
jgi:hypothetical protein